MVLPSNVKYVSRNSDGNRKPKRLKRHKKVALVFDEEKRREFLGGFHKRKVQRQKRAQEELQHQLKEEKKKIKQDAREKYKTLVSRRDVPELEELLSQHKYETEGCTVSILEMNIADLSQKNNLIGENRTTYESDNDKEDSDAKSIDNEIPGMELKNSAKLDKTDSKTVQPVKNFETKKEVKRAVKHAALKQVQKSKAFQLKQRLEHQKNKKQTMRMKQKNDRIMKKHGKKVKKKMNH